MPIPRAIAPGVYVLPLTGAIPVNGGLVIGPSAVCVIDSGSTEAEGQALAEAARRLTPAPVRWVVTTHHHGDHWLGNAAFPDAALLGQTRCVARLAGNGAAAERDSIAALAPRAARAIRSARLSPPTIAVEDERTLDLGGRRLRLQHPGRGHTDNDLIVVVDDAGVVFAGDLVEESGPPAFEDAATAAWPETVRRVAALGRVFVPGHGAVVDAAFLRRQAERLDALERHCATVAAGGGDAASAGASLAAELRDWLGAQAAVAMARWFSEPTAR